MMKFNDVIYKGCFIWNRLKAENNRRDHGITFVKGKYMTVSFTLRDNFTRIFSARKADSDEEEAYNENIRRYIGER